MFNLSINKDGNLVAIKGTNRSIFVRIGDVLRATEDFCGFKLGEYYTVTKLNSDAHQSVYLKTPTASAMVRLEDEWITSGKLEVYLKSFYRQGVNYATPKEEYEVQAGDVLYDKDTVAPFIVLNKSDKYNGYYLYNVRGNERQSMHTKSVASRFLLEDTPWYREEP